MYPYYTTPWQFMAQQPQQMGYAQPLHPMQQPQAFQQPLLPQNTMLMMAPMPYEQMVPHHAPVQQVPMYPVHMHPNAQAPMPMQTMMQSVPPVIQQQIPMPQSPQQFAPPPLASTPQPIQHLVAAQSPVMASQDATRQFIEDDQDDFDQERFDAIKARIRKLRGALRETV